METVVFANNRVGAEVTHYLASERPETLAGLVVHPQEKAKYRDQIVEASGLGSERIIEAPALSGDEGRHRLREWNADVGLSVYFGYILDGAVLDVFDRGCLNLHPALLPYNRGVHTNIWSIVDQTPAGVSLHVLKERIDAGEIIAQRETEKRPTDTGETLYYRLEEDCIDLFRDAWPKYVRGEVDPQPQDPDEGTYHEVSDLENIDHIELDETYQARELIDRLRARTFPPYEGCYFKSEGKKIYMRLQLWHEDEQSPEHD